MPIRGAVNPMPSKGKKGSTDLYNSSYNMPGKNTAALAHAKGNSNVKPVKRDNRCKTGKG